MDLSALIDEFRNQSGDHGVPAFWPDPTVTAFLNRAEHEAAERAKLLPDKTTASVVNVPLVIGQTDYLLHPSIFDVVGVWLSRGGTDSRRWQVCRSLEGDISYDQQHRPTQAGWAREFDVYGEPGQLRLRLDRAPAEAGGSLQLEVYRYPLMEMEDGGDEPEIAPRHHDGLIYWALKIAYETRDMEGSASARAVHAEAEFIKRFGERHDANVMRKKRRHRAPVVRPARF